MPAGAHPLGGCLKPYHPLRHGELPKVPALNLRGGSTPLIRSESRLFLSLNDQFVRKLLYLFGGHLSTRPIDTSSVGLDEKNSQGSSGASKRSEH